MIFLWLDLYLKFCNILVHMSRGTTVEKVLAVVSSIVVVGALTRCALFPSVWDLKAAQMNAQTYATSSNWDITPQKWSKTFAVRKMKIQLITVQ